MKYNIDGNVFENHPELKDYEEFNSEAPFSSSRFVYVYLVYGADSPLAGIDDIIKRKDSAYKTSGLPKELKQRIISNQDEQINQMVMRFFKMENEPEVELLMSGKEAFHILLAEVRSPVSDELNDDRKANALKAKRVCFEDAYNILGVVKNINEVIRNSGTDISLVFEKSKKKEEWTKGWVENLVDSK